MSAQERIEQMIQQHRWKVAQRCLVGEKVNTIKADKELAAAIVAILPELVEIDEEKAVDILWGKLPNSPEYNRNFQNMCTQMNILCKANPIKVRNEGEI